ncbi:hypothetical protein M2263_001426 [Providencia alcalifaciens]|nr:hypothetical protein [Providencia alcalifaciens]
MLLEGAKLIFRLAPELGTTAQSEKVNENCF